MIYIISILSILVVVLGFTTFNLLRKIEKTEDMISYYESYMKEVDEQIKFIEKRIKEIDAKGTFESDDEVGFFFQRLKLLAELLITYKLNK
jgi:hypothetical protein